MRTSAIAALAAVAILTPAARALPASAAPSQSDDRAMTRLAAQVVSDASAGRQALVNGNTGAARSDIDNALAARDGLAEKARAAGLPMIVPVYEELDDTAVLGSAVKSNANTQPKTPATVRANDADLTFLAIDLDKAKAHLDAAKAALADQNKQSAEDSLAAVGSDLVAESVVTDVPLLTAREDLAQAQKELKSGDRAAVAADLQQASKSLVAYTAAPHAGDARMLASEIDAYAGPGAQRPPGLEGKIEGWWSSVTSWFDNKVH
jgi:hypothetical protein